MRSDTSRGLRYYYQGEFLAMGGLMALIAFLLVLVFLASAGGLGGLSEVGLSLVILLPMLGVLLLVMAGGVLSLVGLITLRNAHSDYRKALVAMVVSIPCSLLSQFHAGVLGILAGLAGTVVGLLYMYYIVQATIALLEERRTATDLPGSAADFLDRLISRGYLGWKMTLVVGVASCATAFIQSIQLLQASPLTRAVLSLQVGPLMMGFLLVLFVVRLVGWWLMMELLRKARCLL